MNKNYIRRAWDASRVLATTGDILHMLAHVPLIPLYSVAVALTATGFDQQGGPLGGEEFLKGYEALAHMGQRGGYRRRLWDPDGYQEEVTRRFLGALDKGLLEELRAAEARVAKLDEIISTMDDTVQTDEEFKWLEDMLKSMQESTTHLS